MNFDSDLTTAPIPGLIRKLGIPVSVGYFFHTMFNVVDTYFAGLISTQALAALSASFPVFFILIAVGSGFSVGATALIANALGAGDSEQARHFALQALTFALILALAVTCLGLVSAPYLFRALGAKGEYLDFALAYMDTIFLGSVFFMLNYMFNAVLNSQGRTKPMRNFLILGFFLNVALDPWFIYGGWVVPPLGVTGVALATVAIQATGTIYLGLSARRTGMLGGFGLKALLPKWQAAKQIMHQGLPASVNYMTIGLGIYVILYFVGGFGEKAVAAYGAAVRVEQIILMPTIGLNVATLSLVAQNNGAGLYSRIHLTVRTALAYGGVLMALGAGILLVLAHYLLGFFTDDPQVQGMGALYLRIDALTLFAYVVLFVSTAALQGVKKPMFAIWIGLFRQFAAPVAIFFLCTQILALGLVSIWWGVFGITWSAAAIAYFYARRQIARLAPKLK
jgi:putative MATE family efflux protein